MSKRELPVPQALQFPVGVFWAVLDATSDAARQLPGYFLRLPLAGLVGVWRVGQAVRAGGSASDIAWPAPVQPAPRQPAPRQPAKRQPAPVHPAGASHPANGAVSSESSALSRFAGAKPTLTAVPDADAPKAPEAPGAPEAAEAVEFDGAPEVAKVTNPLDLPPEVLDADVVPGAELGHDKLPLPDYDHMTLGSLRGRLRSLDLVSLVQIRDYERAHANRLPIVSMLENRIVKMTAAATPTGSR